MSEELKKIPVPKSKDFKLESINHVNFNPHPYMITARHVGYASDNHCGMLTQLAIEEGEKEGIKCGFNNCNISYKDHISDKVLFIKALVDKPIKELRGLKTYLKSIVKVLNSLKIQGVAFIEPNK